MYLKNVITWLCRRCGGGDMDISWAITQQLEAVDQMNIAIRVDLKSIELN